MSLDPDGLFDETARHPGPRLTLLVAALLGNGLAPTVEGNGGIGLLGLVAFLLEGRGHARYVLAVGALQAAAMVVGSLFLLDDAATGSRLALRFFAGLAWLLWFSSTVPWPALKATLRRWRFPESVLDAVDTTIAQGLLLLDQLVRRRTAATVRHGLAPGQPLLQTYGLILAGGVESAIDRSGRLEDARALRTAGTSAATPPGPALSARKLSVAHGDGHRALEAVDLEVARGEWVAIAGPSGAGKSTLLAALAGILPPAGGELQRLGTTLGPGPLGARVDRRVALVFQDPNDQLFGATPLEDMIWGLRRHGVALSEARERACRVLDELGIASLRDRPQHRLSAGERKRTAFAAALVVQPELLLVDEPTSNLDPVAARRLLRVLERAAGSRGTTVVWASHDLDLLPAPVARIVLLRGGRVTFDGPLGEGLSVARLTAAGMALENGEGV